MHRLGYLLKDLKTEQRLGWNTNIAAFESSLTMLTKMLCSWVVTNNIAQGPNLAILAKNIEVSLHYQDMYVLNCRCVMAQLCPLRLPDTLPTSLWNEGGQKLKQCIFPLLNNNKETIYQIGRLISFVIMYKTHSN